MPEIIHYVSAHCGQVIYFSLFSAECSTAKGGRGEWKNCQTSFQGVTNMKSIFSHSMDGAVPASGLHLPSQWVIGTSPLG